MKRNEEQVILELEQRNMDVYCEMVAVDAIEIELAFEEAKLDDKKHLDNISKVKKDTST